MAKTNSHGGIIPDVDFGAQGDEPEQEGRVEPTGADSETAITTNAVALRLAERWSAEAGGAHDAGVTESADFGAQGDDEAPATKAPAKKAPAKKAPAKK